MLGTNIFNGAKSLIRYSNYTIFDGPTYAPTGVSTNGIVPTSLLAVPPSVALHAYIKVQQGNFILYSTKDNLESRSTLFSITKFSFSKATLGSGSDTVAVLHLERLYARQVLKCDARAFDYAKKRLT